MNIVSMFDKNFHKTLEIEGYERFEEITCNQRIGCVYESLFHDFDQDSEVYSEYISEVDVPDLKRVVQQYLADEPDFEYGYMQFSYYWLVRMPDDSLYPFPLLFATEQERIEAAIEAEKNTHPEQDIEWVKEQILSRVML